MLRLNLRFLSFLLCIIQSVELQAAPSVPTFLTENGLTYCTHASGFHLIRKLQMQEPV